MLYIYAEVEIFAFLSLSRFSRFLASDGVVELFEELDSWFITSRRMVKFAFRGTFSFSLNSCYNSQQLNTKTYIRAHFYYYFSPKLCPLFLSSSSERERETERQRQTLSRARDGEKIILRCFRTDALALPEKEVLFVCFFSLFFCTKNRLNGHLKAVSSFPDLSLLHHVRGSSDRGRSSFMRESRGGDVRVRVSSGDV